MPPVTFRPGASRAFSGSQATSIRRVPPGIGRPLQWRRAGVPVPRGTPSASPTRGREDADGHHADRSRGVEAAPAPGPPAAAGAPRPRGRAGRRRWPRRAALAAAWGRVRALAPDPMDPLHLWLVLLLVAITLASGLATLAEALHWA